MTDGSDSWSLVDAEDEASRDQTSRTTSSELSSADGQGVVAVSSDDGPAMSDPAEGNEQLHNLLASRGNDSPPRPAVLEAVEGNDVGQSWSLASRSHSGEPPSHDTPAQDEPQESFSVSQPSLSGQQIEDQTNTKPDQSPSESESDPASSLGPTDSVFIPDTLPCVQTDHEYQGSLDDDSMSEGSSGTAVMVGHPCSDEEDTAERRWRRAEQRGNDIRRASAPPCPRAVGPEGYLKVIVVGESGLGKSTFIENLRSAFQPDSPSSAGSSSGLGEALNTYEVFEQAPELLCTKVTITNGTSTFHYFLQDTPGLVYEQTTVRIPEYITDQNARYLKWEQNPERSAPMSATDDHRVDACLFFLNPNHLKDAEVKAMVQISELVPTVPMIAKADIFTPSELTAFRAHVRQRIAQEEEGLGRRIMWRAVESKEEDDDEGCRQPPFAVIASSHSDLAVGRFWPVRSYPWGKCEAFSSSNSDLASLKHLLFEQGFAGLKQATETRYYRYRASRLSLANEQLASIAHREWSSAQHTGTEEAGEDNSGWQPLPDLPSSDTSSEFSDMPEILPGDPAEAAAARADGRREQRRGRRNPWMLALLVAGVICTVGYNMVDNMQQLKADNRHLRRELAIKEQAVSEMDAALPGFKAQLQQPLKVEGLHLHDVKLEGPIGQGSVLKGTTDQGSGSDGPMCRGSGCTMLMSPWRQSVTAPAKHIRPQKQSAFAENATDAGIGALQSTTILGAHAKANITSEQPQKQEMVYLVITSHSNVPMALYTPTRFQAASSSAIQTVNQAAQSARRFSSTASTNSLMAFKSAAQHTAFSARAATKAVVEFSQAIADKTHSLSHKTGVALYSGLKQSSSCVMLRFSAGHQAVKHASHATAAALGSFGSDVVDATRVMARDAPAVARRMQQDLGSAVLDMNSVVKGAGVAVGKGLSQTSKQVSEAAQSSVQYMKSAYQGVNMPSTQWDSRAWIRFFARLGIFGAAL